LYIEATSHFLGAFSQNIECASSIEAEFSACIYAIERVSEMLLVDIWMETESLISVQGFLRICWGSLENDQQVEELHAFLE
jgi:ribonuclease HI